MYSQSNCGTSINMNTQKSSMVYAWVQPQLSLDYSESWSGMTWLHTGCRMVPRMTWLGQDSKMICTSLWRSRDSVKNFASAAKGSGVSLPSASRLNVGHWRDRFFKCITEKIHCLKSTGKTKKQTLKNNVQSYFTKKANPFMKSHWVETLVLPLTHLFLAQLWSSFFHD